VPARTLIKAQGRHVRGRLGFLFYPGFCRGAWLRTLRWRRCHLLQNFEADPSLGLCEIVIKHLLGCALEFNWIPILLVAVNCCPWLEENYLAIGLQLL